MLHRSLGLLVRPCSFSSAAPAPVTTPGPRPVNVGRIKVDGTSPRWYSEVELVRDGLVHRSEPAYTVLLDSRRIETPKGFALLLPNEMLGRAVATEWEAQREKIKPVSSMPITSLCTTAIDHVPRERLEYVERLTQLLNRDVTLWRASSEQRDTVLPVSRLQMDSGAPLQADGEARREVSLRARQDERYSPFVSWFEREMQVSLEVHTSEDVLHDLSQPERAQQKVENTLRMMDPWRLSCVNEVARVCGSIVLALALLQYQLNAHECFACARLEEELQIENWGSLEEDHGFDRAHTMMNLSSAALVLNLLDRGGGQLEASPVPWPRDAFSK